MKHRRLFRTINILAAVAGFLAMAGAPPSSADTISNQAATPHEFPHPDRIRYDGQCMTIDGKDMVIFSGSFHYFRCPRELWADRFEKIKQAGFNTVETYVPWNWSEPEMPTDVSDMSKVKLDDLRDWLKMAIDQFGLYVIIRPGPYICAEWNTGGFPRWLFNKKPKGSNPWFRTDDPTYLAWCKHWYDAVCATIVPWQITHRPRGSHGIILFQIENEYNAWNASDEVKTRSLKALYQDAVSDGIDVPIFTCLTNQTRGSKDPVLRNVFDANNNYPRRNTGVIEKDAEKLHAVQPDAPLMISELQGGWFSGVGGRLSDDPDTLGPAEITAITMSAWSHDVRITNYYMLFGGTNFGGWNGRDITTTYDYYAPIRECGGVGDKYAAVAALGRFITERGAGLARAKLIPSHIDGNPSSMWIWVDRGADGAHYLFCTLSKAALNSAALVIRANDGTIITIHPAGGPGEQAILYLPPGKTDSGQGTWYLKPADLPQRPASLPSPIRVASAQERVDAGVGWKALPGDGKSLTAMLRFTPTFSHYRTTVHADAHDLTDGALLTMNLYSPDEVRVSVDGHLAPVVTTGKPDQCAADLTGLLHEGDNSIEMLYNDEGDPNWKNVGTVQGIRDAALIARSSADQPVKQWLTNKPSPLSPSPLTLADATTGDSEHWWLPAESNASWTKIPLDTSSSIPRQSGPMPLPSQTGQPLGGKSSALLTWYRCDFSLPAPPANVWIPWHARIGAVGDGYLFLNGHPLGRYYNAGPQREFFLPECWLHFGADSTNQLVVSLRPAGPAACLEAVEIAPYADLAEIRGGK